jgi:hypothetical protein
MFSAISVSLDIAYVQILFKLVITKDFNVPCSIKCCTFPSFTLVLSSTMSALLFLKCDELVLMFTRQISLKLLMYSAFLS